MKDIVNLQSTVSADGTGRTLYAKYRDAIDRALTAYEAIAGQEDNLDARCRPLNQPDPEVAVSEVQQRTHSQPSVVEVTVPQSTAGPFFVELTGGYNTVEVPQGSGSYSATTSSWQGDPNDSTPYVVHANIAYQFYPTDDHIDPSDSTEYDRSPISGQRMIATDCPWWEGGVHGVASPDLHAQE